MGQSVSKYYLPIGVLRSGRGETRGKSYGQKPVTTKGLRMPALMQIMPRK